MKETSPIKLAIPIYRRFSPIFHTIKLSMWNFMSTSPDIRNIADMSMIFSKILYLEKDKGSILYCVSELPLLGPYRKCSNPLSS